KKEHFEVYARNKLPFLVSLIIKGNGILCTEWVRGDSVQAMMFRVSLSAIKTDQWLPQKSPMVRVFDVRCAHGLFLDWIG
ncbi:unnamed protein product, partial [Larinioides sclopetarius]